MGGYLLPFTMLVIITKPRYSKKHYERKGLYGSFIESAINSGSISNEALNWAYMNQALKEQRYLLPRNAAG